MVTSAPMRIPAVLLPLLFLACRSAPTPPDVAPPSREELLARAVEELGGVSSAVAEALLASAGEEAVPLLLALVEAEPGSEAAGRAMSVLLLAGVELSLSAGDRVDLLLADLAREEEYPYVGLRAIDVIRSMGEDALPALRERSRLGGAKGDAARRLLAVLREEP